MRALFFLFLFSSSFVLFSQQIQIVDENSNRPVNDVFVFNIEGTITTKSDENGYFELSLFTEGSIISFQHPSYFSSTYSYQDIESLSIVKLKEQVLQMNELVVSANKWEQSTADIPNTIAIIKPQEIEFQNPQTTADILDQSGKVFIQKSQAGGGSPMIRGFSANSVLIVVDGVRMNNAIFRSGNLQNVVSIDPNSLQNTEVIFGPGSVIYGSDALGGVMDFHTRTPDFSESKKIEGTVMSRYSSANNEKTSHINITIPGPKLTFFTGWTFSSFDHLRSGKNAKDGYEDFGLRESYQDRVNGTDIVLQNQDPTIQIGTAYDQWNGLAKLRYKISNDKSITYGFYMSNTSNIPRYDRLIRFNGATPNSAEWNYGPQKWIRNSLQYIDLDKKSLYDGIKLTTALQSFEESRLTRDFNDPERRERTENVDVVSLNLDLDKSIGETKDLFYGFEFVYNDVQSKARKVNIDNGVISGSSTRYPDGGSSYQSSALYVNYVSTISEKVIFNAGSRLNQVHLQSSFDDKTYFNFPFNTLEINRIALNGNTGLVLKPNEKWKLDILLSTGFRAPNVDDAGKLFDSEPGNVIVPNPDLKPEKAYNIDLGISRIVKNNLKIDITGFYTLVDDIITRRDYLFNGQDSIIYDNVLSRVQALQNVSGGFIYGGSIYLKATLNRNLHLISTLTFTDGEDDQGNAIRHASPTFGRTSLQYAKNNLILEMYSVYNGALAFEDLAPSEQNKGYLYTEDGSLSWVTLNLKLSYQLGDQLKIFGGIENITDLHYRPYSSGISAPGRNYILSAKFSF